MQSQREIRAINREVRRRDGFACAACGMSNAAHIERYGRQLDVHRIVPGSIYAIDGCTTRCKVCHGLEDKRESGQPDAANGERYAPKGRNAIPGFGGHLKSLRDAAGLSQRALAKLAMLAPDTVVKLEGGERQPSLVAAGRLAEALGLDSLADLLPPGVPGSRKAADNLSESY